MAYIQVMLCRLELLMNALPQHLWKYSHWRENIIVKVEPHFNFCRR